MFDAEERALLQLPFATVEPLPQSLIDRVVADARRFSADARRRRRRVVCAAAFTLLACAIAFLLLQTSAPTSMENLR